MNTNYLWTWILLASCGGAKESPISTEGQPAKVESAKVESAKVESAKVESAKVEPAKVKPAKVEPAKVEPAHAPIAQEPASLPTWCNGACNALLNEPFTSWSEKVGQECNVDWQSFEDNNCDQWDYLRNCVYAAGGKVFRKDHVQEDYADFPWYSPDKNFTHDQLSSVAKANIKLTKTRKKSCTKANDHRPGELVNELQVDLDGDGTNDTIRVTTTRVFINGQEFIHQLKPYGVQALKVQILDIDTGDSYKEVLISNYYYEGNARRRVLSKYSTTVKMSDIFSWHDIEMKSEGKGKMRMYSGECGQKREELYGVKKGVFQLVKKTVKGKFREELCSACPYVYVWQHERWQYQGEILRNLRSPSLENTHHLPLGQHSAGVLRVRLGERKEETTFVDLFEVVARYDDGSEEVLKADECGTNAPAFCVRDQGYSPLQQGENIDLSFRLPRSAHVFVRSRGYYIPIQPM